MKNIFVVRLLTVLSLGMMLMPASLQAENTRRGKITREKSSVSVNSISSEKAEKKSTRLEAWLKKVKKRMTVAQTKRNRLVAVAAVRGDEVKESAPLYWKNKKTEASVSDDELKAFESAINDGLKGDEASTQSQLESFISTYPQSPLVEDAKETLKLMALSSPNSESSSGN